MNFLLYAHYGFRRAGDEEFRKLKNASCQALSAKTDSTVQTAIDIAIQSTRRRQHQSVNLAGEKKRRKKKQVDALGQRIEVKHRKAYHSIADYGMAWHVM